jgi:hypothetical protein
MIKIYQPPKPHWVGDGFRVSGFLHAYPELENRLNPFLLLDYHPPFHYAPLLPDALYELTSVGDLRNAVESTPCPSSVPRHSSTASGKRSRVSSAPATRTTTGWNALSS